MPNIGPVELIIILVIALLVLGPGKLPEVGSALGKSIREFRKAASDVQDAVKVDAAPATPPAAAAPTPPAAPVPAPAPNTLSAPAEPNVLAAVPAADAAASEPVAVSPEAKA